MFGDVAFAEGASSLLQPELEDKILMNLGHQITLGTRQPGAAIEQLVQAAYASTKALLGNIKRYFGRAACCLQGLDAAVAAAQLFNEPGDFGTDVVFPIQQLITI